jgi:hypothetical protein
MQVDANYRYSIPTEFIVKGNLKGLTKMGVFILPNLKG